MDALRNAMGYGAQSGQEPLSGQTGQGTASEPYDAGNVAGILLYSPILHPYKLWCLTACA